MLLVIVYVGAVAVLFLFVVMMLDVDFVELKQGFLRYLPIAGALALLVVVELIMTVFVWVFPDEAAGARALPSPTAAETVTRPEGPNNIEEFGLVLYTDYIHYFQIAGIILLVAMIGAIILMQRRTFGKWRSKSPKGAKHEKLIRRKGHCSCAIKRQSTTQALALRPSKNWLIC